MRELTAMMMMGYIRMIQFTMNKIREKERRGWSGTLLVHGAFNF